MNKTLFATVNGKEILGEDILQAKARILAEHTDNSTFVNTPNEDNSVYLNTEALQKLIEINSLIALAKFEGITVDDEELTEIIYELRSHYKEESDWQYILQSLGMDNKNLRYNTYCDLMIDKLLRSRFECSEEPSDNSIQEYYNKNIEFMKSPNIYTFIELEIPNQEKLPLAVNILSYNDSKIISKEAISNNFQFVLNDSIPFNKLPEPLQAILEDLEINKIGTLPTEEEAIILVKLLQKIKGKVLEFEEVFSGLKEYLKIQQQKGLMDNLTEDSMDKCDIIYHNTDLLKELI